MEHEEIKRAFNEVYNNFYLKYRFKGVKKTDEEWEEIVKNANDIVSSFNSSVLVRHMIVDLLEIIETDEKNNGSTP